MVALLSETSRWTGGVLVLRSSPPLVKMWLRGCKGWPKWSCIRFINFLNFRSLNTFRFWGSVVVASILGSEIPSPPPCPSPPQRR